MLKYLVSLVLLASLVLSGKAQVNYTIRGKVTDDKNIPLPNLTVSLYYMGSPDTLRKLSGSVGDFSFSDFPMSRFTMTVSGMGYAPFNKYFQFAADRSIIQLDSIRLIRSASLLQSVTITSDKAITIKEDTIEYKADSFRVKPNAMVEELLKKLPGLQVDKNGNITAQGKSVNKVKVDGKDFFGGDTKTATQQLPADMIDKVQVIDDYGDQANFTGIKDGDPQKVLNLQTKKNRNKGYFGDATLSVGTDQRYQANAAAFKFSGDQQVALLTNLNNTNSSPFNFTLPGLGSSGGGAGMTMVNIIQGNSNGGSSGNSGNGAVSNTAANNGLIDNKSVGVNYRDQWGKKLSSYGNYNLLRRGTITQSSTTQQNIFTTGTNITVQSSKAEATGNNYRFNQNLEYQMDSANYVKFIPAIAYNTNHTHTLTDFEVSNDSVKSNAGTQEYTSDVKAPNYSGSLLFNRRFGRRGRTFSANFTGSYTGTNQTDDNKSNTTYYLQGGNFYIKSQDQQIRQENTNSNYGVRFSYTEPINRTSNLEMNYSYNQQFIRNDKKTFAVDSINGELTLVDSLTGDYENTYTTHRIGLNVRTSKKKYNYSAGMAFQPALIQSYTRIAKTSSSQYPFNYYPVARFAYNFSRSRSLEVNYSGRTNQPTYTQLQPVVDISNQLNIIVGNPNLRPEFNNTLNLSYNKFEFLKGDVFFSNLSLTFTRDKIANNTLNKGMGIQETHYVNANGYYTANMFYLFAKPFANQRLKLTANGTASYTHNISFIDSLQNNGKNWVLNQNAGLDITLREWLEWGMSLQYQLNSNRYSIRSQQATRTTSYTIGSNARIDLAGKWVLHYDIEKTFNQGYTSSGTTNPFIINGYVEKQIFQKMAGSLRLQTFDLLNQNNSVSRTVSANAIIDSRTNTLGRYYLLSFLIRLAKFGGKITAPPGPP